MKNVNDYMLFPKQLDISYIVFWGHGFRQTHTPEIAHSVVNYPVKETFEYRHM